MRERSTPTSQLAARGCGWGQVAVDLYPAQPRPDAAPSPQVCGCFEHGRRPLASMYAGVDTRRFFSSHTMPATDRTREQRHAFNAVASRDPCDGQLGPGRQRPTIRASMPARCNGPDGLACRQHLSLTNVPPRFHATAGAVLANVEAWSAAPKPPGKISGIHVGGAQPGQSDDVAARDAATRPGHCGVHLSPATYADGCHRRPGPRWAHSRRCGPRLIEGQERQYGLVNLGPVEDPHPEDRRPRAACVHLLITGRTPVAGIVSPPEIVSRPYATYAGRGSESAAHAPGNADDFPTLLKRLGCFVAGRGVKANRSRMTCCSMSVQRRAISGEMAAIRSTACPSWRCRR